jgi:hypothetical protein
MAFVTTAFRKRELHDPPLIKSKNGSDRLFATTLNKAYERLLSGKDSVANQLLRLRKKLPKNYALQELYTLFSWKIASNRKDVTQTHNVKLFARRYDAYEYNKLTNSLKELYDSQDTEVKNFAIDLAALATVQNGMTKTPITFTDIIPAEVIQPAYRRILKTFIDEVGSGSKDEREKIIRAFQLTNYQNRRIVPSLDYQHIHDKKRGYHYNQAEVPANNPLLDFQFLTYRIPTVSDKEATALKTAGKVVPKKTVIFVKTDKLTADGKTIYLPAPVGRGEGMYAKEFYTDTQLSWLMANNDGKIMDKTGEIVEIPDILAGPIVELHKGFWTREEVAKHPEKVYLFGDNTKDRTETKYVPSSTQAVIRGLTNAIGIDTKKDRGINPTSYFTDNDFAWFKQHVDQQIQAAKATGKTIVIPADGIGTGKAMLKEKAPKLFAYLDAQLKALQAEPTILDHWTPDSTERTTFEQAVTNLVREKRIQVPATQRQAVEQINKHSDKNNETVEEAANELLVNFDKYFPAYSDFTASQKALFVKLLQDGKFEIYC